MVDGVGFNGTGISAEGVSGVTLRNLRVRGFNLGLHVADGASWIIEDSDFSDNFHDPDWGWEQHPPAGGLLLERVSGSRIVHSRANRVWDACYLLGCEDNIVEANDFSYTSDTCLKLWACSRNSVQSNNLSHGIRISPGEVHARDSCCVLIESSSHDNRFLDNDATYGGDGFFIRVLDGNPSSGNLFQRNDASYAHNNCFEAWAAGNTYLENRANHGSYGFWLGNSNETVLIGNEAGWNGEPSGNHNAPEAFGHGGIVFVNGSSEYVLAVRNQCHHNAGGGIVIRGGGDFRSAHWLIQHNRLEANPWGLYIERAEDIQLGPNDFTGNVEADILNAGGVSGLRAYEEPLDEQAWLSGWPGRP